MKLFALLPILFVAIPGLALAGPDDFHAGQLLPDFGTVASIEDPRLGPETRFMVAFDIAQAGEDGKQSRRLLTPARFLNMHFDAGVPAENMKLALVIHGPAVRDVQTAQSLGATNPNSDLIAALLAQGVTIEVCGQSAAYYGVAPDDLLPGVTMALSAMTAHALLQQQGYTLNPF